MAGKAFERGETALISMVRDQKGLRLEPGMLAIGRGDDLQSALAGEAIEARGHRRDAEIDRARDRCDRHRLSRVEEEELRRDAFGREIALFLRHEKRGKSRDFDAADLDRLGAGDATQREQSRGQCGYRDRVTFAAHRHSLPTAGRFGFLAETIAWGKRRTGCIHAPRRSLVYDLRRSARKRKG